MTGDEIRGFHLESGEAAAYLDGGLSVADRNRVEAHVTDCDACRSELIGVARLLRTAPARRIRYLSAGLAAAAVIALFLVSGLYRSNAVRPAAHREPAVTTTVAPAGIAPHGSVTEPIALVWSGVPHADRYRLRVFDPNGSVVWESETVDTSFVLPDSVGLRRGVSYFWKVEARTAMDRWVASDLIDFTVLARPRP